jgi:DNA-binding transcriptional LysR family regulator
MELRQLQRFLVVAEELSFTKAAKRLHIAQPPLTQQIHRLEADLGVQLFDRTTRRVSLTPAGEALRRDVSALLAQFDDALDHARQIAAGRRGRIVVGFIEPAVFDVLPRTVNAFRRRYPDIEVALRELSSVNQVEALRQGTIDVALLRRQPTIRRDIATKRIRREPLSLVTSVRHPLARSNAPVRLSELADEQFVMVNRSNDPILYDYVETACRRAGFTMQRAQVANQLSTVLSLVAAQVGITFGTPAAVQGAGARLHVRPLADKPALMVDMHVAWLADQVTPASKNFLDVLTQEI